MTHFTKIIDKLFSNHMDASDDAIVTSLETTLSRTTSGKGTTIFCLITLEN